VSGGDGQRSAIPTRARPAVTELFHLHYRRLVGLAVLLVGDQETAEDVVHDSFEGLYRHWRQVRDPEAAAAYLTLSVVNGSLSRARSRGLDRIDALPHVDIQRELARAALTQPHRQREVLDSTLVAALEDEAEKTVLSVDGVAAARRLEARLDAVDQSRRPRTRRVAMAVAASVIVIVVAVALVGRPDQPTVDHSIGKPRPAVAGGLLIRPDPYLPDWFTSDWHVVQEPDAKVPRLTHCIPDLRSWGSLYAQGMTYVDPNPTARRGVAARRVNEWLLQFPDASGAHRALVNTFRRLASCARPPDATNAPGHIDRNPDSSWDYDEAFGSQRTSPSTGRHPTQAAAVYVLRVARARNVLVVLEDTGIPVDRTPATMTAAVRRAVPHYRTFHCSCLI
jgi:DNA-directed RNA polymerase specialized sigma24 family protein